MAVHAEACCLELLDGQAEVAKEGIDEPDKRNVGIGAGPCPPGFLLRYSEIGYHDC